MSPIRVGRVAAAALCLALLPWQPASADDSLTSRALQIVNNVASGDPLRVVLTSASPDGSPRFTTTTATTRAKAVGLVRAALSAGQKRRLGLARLLVTGRPLWVLDEPTVSLDAASVGRFAAVVRAHLASGGAALMATHIDLGIEAQVLDLTQFRALPPASGGITDPFDEAFL